MDWPRPRKPRLPGPPPFRFRGVSGTIQLDDNRPRSSSVEVEIDTATIDTGEAKRDEHLRSADFFDVDKFPTITFKSTTVEPSSPLTHDRWRSRQAMETQTHQTPTIAMAPRTTWAIDPVHSHVQFAVRHLMVSTVRGRFGVVSGTITLDEQHLAESSVEVEIDATTIDTREEGRDAHLRSADFLAVERFPTITFRSTGVEPGRGGAFRIVGDLTIRGVTRQVVLEAEQTGRGTGLSGAEVIGFEATTKINRKDFGLTWNAGLETGGVVVGDEIKITIDVEANRQQ